MQKLTKQKRAYKGIKSNAIDFISAGVGCNCLVALHESGILKVFLENENVDANEIENYANPLCINSAIITLEKCAIIKRELDCFRLTEFGRSVSEYIGLITIFFDGYSGLVANQAKIATTEEVLNHGQLVKWEAVSRSSIKISEPILDLVILKEIAQLNFIGTICDLGCGHGTILSKICKERDNCGLGFESHIQTVEEARKQVHSNVKIELGDVTRLQGIWENVAILIQTFVFHDFYPDSKCIEIMNSYLKNFPNLKYFIYIDIMTPSDSKPELFPGFDYVHGLLGIRTRTYEETIKMFSQSGYKIYKEVAIKGLPNTFLWILSR